MWSVRAVDASKVRRNVGPSWQHLADDAVEKARKILKREWEVTKKVQIPCPSDFELRRRKSRASPRSN
jgi:hypothetical protein